ncbi:MAG: hypothetical protein HUJ51_03400 [Eggerthellaceae bacterium]|nr:hypothetical protein [Eggerthellaceae bacterium]
MMIIFLDMEYLIDIDDNFGYDEGSRYLKMLSDIIKQL